jgi:uncharacterized protein YndB with AHSA1/START domain
MTSEKPEFEFVISRVLDAPRELVWHAWTSAEALAKWWGPKDFDNEVVKLDLRVGGVFHYRMNLPDGGVMWGKFVFREIFAPERLVHVDSFSDENENITRAPFSEKFPLEILNTLTLTEENGKTRLELRGKPINATPEEEAFFASMHDSMQQGFGGTFEQLEKYLAQAQEG